MYFPGMNSRITITLGNTVVPCPSSSSMVYIHIYHYLCPLPLMCLKTVPEFRTSSVFGRMLKKVFCKLSPSSSLKLTRDAGSILCTNQMTRFCSIPKNSVLRILLSSLLLYTWDLSPLFSKLNLSATSFIFPPFLVSLIP